MRNKTLYQIIIILIVSFIIYSNTLYSPFHYDDEKVIVKNKSIRDISDLKKIFYSNPSRPVTTFSFALNYKWGKLNLFSYHLVNVLLHGINGVLFFLVLNAVFANNHLFSVFASLVFISHPVNTESVTYISSRSELLCTMFYLLSMIFFIKFLKGCKNSALSGRISGLSAFYFLSILCFLLSIGAKEIGITLPFILILYESCFSTSLRQVNSVKKIVRYKLYYLPFFGIVGSVMVWRKFFYGTFGNPAFYRDYYRNILTQGEVVWSYIRLLFFPINLNIDHEIFLSKSLLEVKTLLSFIGLLILISVVLIIYKRHPEMTFSLLLFFIILGPTLLIPLQDMLSERWLYLPKTGFCMFLALLLIPSGTNRDFSPDFLKSIKICGIILIMFFSILTFSRNYVWGSEVLLWKDAARKSPYKARTFNNLGVALAKLKRYNEAIASFKEAVRIDKYYSPSIANLGKAYRTRGEGALMLKEALSLFESGNYYYKKGMLKEAIISYKELIGLVPNSAAAYGNLGMIYLSLNEKKLAKECFEKVLEYNPESEAAKRMLQEINRSN